MLAHYLEKSNSKDRSNYTPPKAVREMTMSNQKDAQHTYDLQRKSFKEFNDMNILDRQDVMQKTFNTYEEPAPTDQDVSWKWRGVKPTSRNKAISMSAHLIASMLYPNATAQNDKNEEDKESAEVMREMIKWNIDNSDYEMSMLYGVVASCVNPCAYIEVEYVENMQTVREELENGDISIKEVIDQVVSGIQIENIPMEEVRISNFYQFSHQKQPFIIRRKLISFEDFKSKYSSHKNLKFVKSGVQTVFSTEDNTFYDIKEVNKDHLVEELIVKSRVNDLEIPYVNGIYFGKDNVQANRIKHRKCVSDKFGDKMEIPMYNESKWGFEPIDEKKFYYYKSLVDKLWPEQKLLDRMSRLLVDGTVMEALPAIITTGAPQIDSSIVFPAAVTAFPKDATATPLNTGRNLSSVYNSMAEIENTINQSSQDNIRGGLSPDAGRTAYEIARVEQNSIIKEFAIFGRMIGNAVEQIGELMVDLIIKHQTIGEAEQISDGAFEALRIKDRSYNIPNQTIGGKKYTKKITFTDRIMGSEMNDEEKLDDSYKKLDDSKKNGVYLYEVNPLLFANRTYSINIEPDEMMPKLESFREEKEIRARQLMLTSPYADIEAIDRDFLFDPLTEGESDKYMKKASNLGIAPDGQGPSPEQSLINNKEQ